MFNLNPYFVKSMQYSSLTSFKLFSLLLCFALLISTQAGCKPTVDKPPKPEGEVKHSAPKDEEPATEITASMVSDAIFKLEGFISSGNTKKAIEQLSVFESLSSAITSAQKETLDKHIKSLDNLILREQHTSLDQTSEKIDVLLHENKLAEANKLLERETKDINHPELQSDIQSIQEKILKQIRLRNQLSEGLAGLADKSPQVRKQTKEGLLRSPLTTLYLLNEQVPLDSAAINIQIIRMVPELPVDPRVEYMLLRYLSTEQNEAIWGLAAKQFQYIQGERSTKEVLKLAQEAVPLKQRVAAQQVILTKKSFEKKDFVGFLPKLIKDSDELSSALRASRHILFHTNQTDTLKLSEAIESTGSKDISLMMIKEFVLKVLNGDTKTLSGTEAEITDKKIAATEFAVTLGWHEPELIPYKVYAYPGSVSGASITALNDGKWGQKLEENWMHRGANGGWVILDLGETKTVAQLKIWNLSYANHTYGGMKEIDIYVDDQPEPFQPIAHGMIPEAPKTTDVDFSTIINLPFKRGRFVKIKATAAYNTGDETGLSELQVLGW
jgi:hypothetical protein